MSTTPQRQIGIVLFNDVEELDAIGPWEVLSYWTRAYPDDGFAVFTLSPAGGLVQCKKGLLCFIRGLVGPVREAVDTARRR
jgi:hypothetical protein